MARTLVFFHAHPDDEALLTAGSMAKAATEGDRVVLVVATRGEAGDAAAELASGDGGGPDGDGAGGLGAVRMAELARSAEILGVERVEVLGYADSGSTPTSGPSSPPPEGAFSTADVEEAAERLAAICAREQATLLTSYDVNGGYGHPDHRRVHEVARRAAALAGTPLLLEATINRDLMATGVTLARSLGYEIPPEFAGDSFDGWFTPAGELTHAIDVSDHLEAKRAAMAAHASQTTSAEGATRTLAAFLALPEEYFAMAFGTEWYRDPAAPAGTAHDDLFATLGDAAP